MLADIATTETLLGVLSTWVPMWCQNADIASLIDMTSALPSVVINARSIDPAAFV